MLLCVTKSLGKGISRLCGKAGGPGLLWPGIWKWWYHACLTTNLHLSLSVGGHWTFLAFRYAEYKATVTYWTSFALDMQWRAPNLPMLLKEEDPKSLSCLHTSVQSFRLVGRCFVSVQTGIWWWWVSRCAFAGSGEGVESLWATEQLLGAVRRTVRDVCWPPLKLLLYVQIFIPLSAAKKYFSHVGRAEQQDLRSHSYQGIQLLWNPGGKKALKAADFSWGGQWNVLPILQKCL